MALRELEDAIRQLQLSIRELNLSNPIGILQPFAGSTIPAGWLLCDGSAISRADYPALFATIGTTYGAGNGSTTFNLPNAKGRTLVGRDPAQPEFDTLGETGGAKTHTLTTAEMPAHDHAGTTNTDTSSASLTMHGAGSATVLSGGSGRASLGTARSSYRSGGSNIAGVTSYDGFTVNMTHSHPFTTDSKGGSGAHNNLQPYLTTNYIIRAA